jgi:hypothetical protein
MSSEADISEGSIARAAASFADALMASAQKPQHDDGAEPAPRQLADPAAAGPSGVLSQQQSAQLQQEIASLRMQLRERDLHISSLQRQVASSGSLSTPGSRQPPPPAAPASPIAAGATPGGQSTLSLANPLFQDSPGLAHSFDFEQEHHASTPLTVHHATNPDGTPGPSFSLRKNVLFDDQVWRLHCFCLRAHSRACLILSPPHLLMWHVTSSCGSVDGLHATAELSL